MVHRRLKAVAAARPMRVIAVGAEGSRGFALMPADRGVCFSRPPTGW